MAWTEPSFPIAPVGSAEVVTVDGAVLTGFRHGRLRTLQAPHYWTRGAVHDSDGELLQASQRIGGLSGDAGVAADLDRVEVPRRIEKLKGHWLYGGHWMGHFGHFLTETVTSLWPDTHTDITGLIFHRFVFGGHAGGHVEPWQAELVERAGLSLPIRVVRRQPVRVERLSVPTRTVVPNGFAFPEAAEVWRRIAATVEPGEHRRVYLSRTRFNAQLRANGDHVRTSAARDHTVDRVFLEHGFTLAHPEELSIADQIALTAGAHLVAGASGSGLHLSVFSPPGTGVVQVADARLRDRPLPAQRILDTVCGHRSAVLPHAEDPQTLEEALSVLL